ncbi:ABC1 kinase family protein [Alkalinema pantanalense CENA528]|uniref:ABC1 kinase family protein n=1 Tax=Alkalinema pantanalense TaxID=1620705 RepID=UPI003D6E643A
MLNRTHLPFGKTRQAEIIEVVARHGWSYFQNQLSLNPKPEEFSLPLPEVLKQILIELGPTFVKLGQVLSTRPDLLEPAYIQALETLQNQVPPVPWADIEPILQAEFQKPLETLFAEIDTGTIAAGSLGQVYRARLVEGPIVAIKVQRPGIRTVIERDLEVLRSLASFFSQDHFLGQAYDLLGLVEEFRNSILGELDFCREAQNTEKLAQNLAESTFWEPQQVIIPKVYSKLTTSRVLVLEWIDGVKLTEAHLSLTQRKAVATLVVRVVMQQMFLSRCFHADPHPGNFLYLGQDTETGIDRVALLDCGMVAILDPRTQRIMTDLLVGIVYEQPRQVAQAVRELGFSRLDVDIRAIESAFDRLLRRFYTRPLEEINLAELLNAALRIPRENKIQMPGAIGLFVKAIANVEGIARQLDPSFAFIEVARPVVSKSLQRRIFSPDVIPEVARSSLYLSQLMIELPERLDVLVDRLERSELGLNWRWRNQDEFQQVANKLTRRIAGALLSVGCLMSGSLLAIAHTNLAGEAAFTVIPLFWSEGLLILGLGTMAVVIVEWTLRP